MLIFIRTSAFRVVGWFNGRYEHGPRALCNRSIIADPSILCNVLGEDFAKHLSPIGYVRETPWFKDQYIQICGVESLDYMRLHKKFSWADEPSMRLDAIGEKYAGMKKIEYDGNLDKLFEEDIATFIKYNFRDVEILKVLDEKLEYLALTKNLSHKGKHNYQEVYANTKTQDGAISAYLLSKNIIPPAKDIPSN